MVALPASTGCGSGTCNVLGSLRERCSRADAGDEMVVNEAFADEFGVVPGDEIPMEAATTAAFSGEGATR